MPKIVPMNTFESWLRINIKVSVFVTEYFIKIFFLCRIDPSESWEDIIRHLAKWRTTMDQVLEFIFTVTTDGDIEDISPVTPLSLDSWEELNSSIEYSFSSEY